MRKRAGTTPDGDHRQRALRGSSASPRFRLIDVDDKTMRLEYHSTRQGLAPMVVGLLRGLGIRFNTTLDISHTRREDHDEFTLRVQQAA